MENMTDRNPPKRKSTDAQILAAQISLLFLVGFVVIYIASSYLQRSPFENLLSFYGSDVPGMYPNAALPKPYGVHFFGDFLLPQWQSNLKDPWVFKEVVGPPVNNYFPFSMAVFWVFARFSYWHSFLVFLVSSLVIFGYPLIRALQKYSALQRTQIIVSSVILTGPMISLLDRGNLQLLLVALCLVAVHAFNRKKFILSAVLFGLVIAMKAYPVIFLILFIRAKRWRDLFISVSTAFIATWLPLIFYSGSPIQILKSVWENIRIWGDVYAHGYLSYNNSIRGSLLSIDSFQLPYLSSLCNHLYANIGIVILGISLLVAFVLMCPNVPRVEVMLVSVAAICGLVDYVAPYALGMYFIALYFIWSDEGTVPRRWLISYGWLIAVLMMPRGLPVKFWNTNFGFDIPTYTSLLGGICSVGLIVLIFTRHFSASNLRSVLRFDLLKHNFVDQ